ncbi:MAG: hypothetical protein EOM25_08575 [Deltaproteobacteria bacterium]|nr:hypothetical protein [Deltaproteobacteria bacterium]
MMKNWFALVLSLMLAFFTWYLVSGREKVDTWVEIPVEYVKIPKGMIITSGLVNRVQIRVRGSQGLVRGDSVQKLAYIADLGGLKTGSNTIVLDPENIPRFSKALEIIEIEPSRLELTADVAETRKIPVNIRWSGGPDASEFTFIEARSTPESVEIKGPGKVLASLESIATEEVVVGKDNLSLWEGVINLEVPARVETSTNSVRVRLEFAAKTQEIWVKRPVTARAPVGYEMSFWPEYVRIKVDLPLYFLKDESWREMVAVQLEPAASLSEGDHKVSYRVVLPDDTMLLEAKPTQLDVVLTKKGGPANNNEVNLVEPEAEFGP